MLTSQRMIDISGSDPTFRQKFPGGGAATSTDSHMNFIKEEADYDIVGESNLFL